MEPRPPFGWLREPESPVQSSVAPVLDSFLESQCNRILIGAFLPEMELGSGVGDYVDGGGYCPCKRKWPDPDGEIV